MSRSVRCFTMIDIVCWSIDSSMPSIAESIDWARALLLLGAEDIDESMLQHTMSIIVKHRTDLDMVAERVGVKLTDGLIGRQSA